MSKKKEPTLMGDLLTVYKLLGKVEDNFYDNNIPNSTKIEYIISDDDYTTIRGALLHVFDSLWVDPNELIDAEL